MPENQPNGPTPPSRRTFLGSLTTPLAALLALPTWLGGKRTAEASEGHGEADRSVPDLPTTYRRRTRQITTRITTLPTGETFPDQTWAVGRVNDRAIGGYAAGTLVFNLQVRFDNIAGVRDRTQSSFCVLTHADRRWNDGELVGENGPAVRGQRTAIDFANLLPGGESAFDGASIGDYRPQ